MCITWSKIKKWYYCFSLTRHMRILYYMFVSKYNNVRKSLDVFAFLSILVGIFSFFPMLISKDNSGQPYVYVFIYYMSNIGGYLFFIFLFEKLDDIFKSQSFISKIIDVIIFLVAPIGILILVYLAKIVSDDFFSEIIKNVINEHGFEKFILFMRDNFFYIIMPNFSGAPIIFLAYHLRSWYTYEKLDSCDKDKYLKLKYNIHKILNGKTK